VARLDYVDDETRTFVASAYDLAQTRRIHVHVEMHFRTTSAQRTTVASPGGYALAATGTLSWSASGFPNLYGTSHAEAGSCDNTSGSVPAVLHVSRGGGVGAIDVQPAQTNVPDGLHACPPFVVNYDGGASAGSAVYGSVTETERYGDPPPVLTPDQAGPLLVLLERTRSSVGPNALDERLTIRGTIEFAQ